MDKFEEGFVVVNPVFIVIGLPFKLEYTRQVILSVCSDYSHAKDFRDKVLRNSTFFIDVRIDVYDVDTLNDFYLW